MPTEDEGVEGVSQPRAREVPRGRGFATSEEFDRGGLEDGCSATQHAFREARDVGRRCEDTGMSGDTAHQPCVFVVHLALNHSLTEGAVVFGWRDG